MTPELEALAALAARVEALAGPDREVDALVWLSRPEQADCILVAYAEEPNSWRSFGVTDVVSPSSYISGILFRRDGKPQAFCAGWPRYTASLDAALTLVPEGYWAEGSLSSPAALEVHAPMTFDPLGKGWAATPALALVAAALRANTPTQNQKGPHDE